MKDYVVPLGKCDRCKTIVEPRLSTQWFVAVNKAGNGGMRVWRAQRGRWWKRGDQVHSGELQDDLPELDGEHPRLVHLAPVVVGSSHSGVALPGLQRDHRGAGDADALRALRRAADRQDPDVLDTWFSRRCCRSPRWAGRRATRGPGGVLSDVAADHRFRHPVLLGGEDDHDGLPFHDAATSTEHSALGTQHSATEGQLADSVPFREVYIHALVRDAERQKMSKTKGNVLDPIEVIEQYGTDATRFTLAAMASPGTDIAFNPARTEGYRAFANKIWNAARFMFMNVDRAQEAGVWSLAEFRADEASASTQAFRSSKRTLWKTAGSCRASTAWHKKLNDALGTYRFHEAATHDLQLLLGRVLRLVSGADQAAAHGDGQRTGENSARRGR